RVASFNPRPANWPGDAHTQKAKAYADSVSIRARPIGRAMPYSRNVSLRKKIPVFSREPVSKSQ
ncbi:MAG TPA: hypothetical protein VMV97_14350, partial [Sulfuriferula sp.]|nr:hypothetical protein [Sulfuriferula sp.]